MKKVRAYSRQERKRLIIHVLADRIRRGLYEPQTACDLARAMDITASTKLRQILAEMVTDQLLTSERVEEANIAGFRVLYALNVENEAFHEKQKNFHAAKRERFIKLTSSHGTEALQLS